MPLAHPENVTVEAFFARHLARLEALGSRSIKTGREALAKFALHIGPDFPVAEISPADVIGWVIALRDSGAAPRTVRKQVSLLRSALASAVADGLLPINPAAGLPRGILPANVPRPDFDPFAELLDGLELSRLLSTLKIDLSWRALWATLALTGCREGEAAALQWGDWTPHFPLGAIRIARSYSTKNGQTWATKSGTVRRAPVHPALHELLWAWREAWPARFSCEPQDPLLIFPRRWQGTLRPQLQPQVLKAFKRSLAAIQLAPRRLHSLRHTFSTLMLEHGASEVIVDAITHAASQNPRRAYKHATWPALCAAVERLPIELWTPPEQLQLI